MRSCSTFIWSPWLVGLLMLLELFWEPDSGSIPCVCELGRGFSDRFPVCILCSWRTCILEKKERPCPTLSIFSWTLILGSLRREPNRFKAAHVTYIGCENRFAASTCSQWWLICLSVMFAASLLLSPSLLKFPSSLFSCSVLVFLVLDPIWDQIERSFERERMRDELHALWPCLAKFVKVAWQSESPKMVTLATKWLLFSLISRKAAAGAEDAKGEGIFYRLMFHSNDWPVQSGKCWRESFVFFVDPFDKFPECDDWKAVISQMKLFRLFLLMCWNGVPSTKVVGWNCHRNGLLRVEYTYFLRFPSDHKWAFYFFTLPLLPNVWIQRPVSKKINWKRKITSWTNSV